MKQMQNSVPTELRKPVFARVHGYTIILLFEREMHGKSHNNLYEK